MTVVTVLADPIPEFLAGRHSVRAFLKRDVSLALVEWLLRAAATAPSGNNTQPWMIDVVTGDTKCRLTEAILASRTGDAIEPQFEYPYYPKEWREPWLGRRREVGWALYEHMGIKRGERQASRIARDLNFSFFGAPVGMIVSIDRRLGQGALIDVGMFLQALASAAVTRGLATCLQAAFAAHHEEIRAILGIEWDRIVICGVALGYEDKAAKVNELRASRVSPENFSKFHC
jgi:nitroreductase